MKTLWKSVAFHRPVPLMPGNVLTGTLTEPNGRVHKHSESFDSTMLITHMIAFRIVQRQTPSGHDGAVGVIFGDEETLQAIKDDEVFVNAEQIDSEACL